MFIRTIKAVQAIAIVFISFSASAQAYHHPIHADNFNQQTIIDSSVNANMTSPDSSLETHLQFSVRQTLYDNLTFRVAVSNPLRKGATISISHNDETSYLAANIKGNYQNLFDLSQLEDGNYTLLVTNGKEKISKEIIISTSVKTDRQVQLN
jgi:uncharacterized protein (DUF2249 family)